MSKRNVKNCFLILTIFVYAIIYRLFIFTHALKYSESITAAVIILLTFFAIKLLGFQKNKKTKIKQYITNVTITIIVLFFVLSYGLGLVVGFLKNAYSLTFPSIIDNIFSPIVIIIGSEIFRYVIVSSNKDKKYVVVLATIAITIFELAFSVKALNNTDYVGLFKVFTSTVLPIISKNIVLSFLAYQVGYIPGLVYRLVMDIYVFVMPIVPDLGDYLSSMIGIGLPFVIYIYASRSLDEYNNNVERTFGNETFRLVDIPLYGFLVLLICLISGLFPYYIIGVGSESMEPKIKKGDAVIIHKVKAKDLLAQAICHEVDHLDGHVFINKIIQTWQFRFI